MRIDGAVIQLSASIGVLVPGAGAPLSSEVLLKAADDAMYRAKQAGKGRFVLHEIPRARHGAPSRSVCPLERPHGSLPD